MSKREFVESFWDGDEYVEVYKDKDGYIVEVEYDDEDYDDIYGPTDVSPDFGGAG